MKPEIKKKWTEALMSGKYKQGHGRLRAVSKTNEKEYCCLGVLCDLYLKEKHKGWNLKMTQNREENPKYAVSLSNQAFLPFKVQEWAGLNSADPAVEATVPFSRDRSLASLNDAGNSFNHIADAIESSL